MTQRVDINLRTASGTALHPGSRQPSHNHRRCRDTRRTRCRSATCASRSSARYGAMPGANSASTSSPWPASFSLSSCCWRHSSAHLSTHKRSTRSISRSAAPGFPWEHPFGTDSLGRDILARILWGGRISLAVGIVAALVAILLGTAIGAVSGFFGGLTDTLLMRLTDLFISLPQVPLLLVISFLYKQAFYDFFQQRTGSGVTGIFVLIVMVIGLLNWMPTSRLVRASFLSTKQKEFVEAAEAMGSSRASQMFRHILPNVIEPNHRRRHPRSRCGDHHRVGALLSRSWLPVRHPDLGEHAL